MKWNQHKVRQKVRQQGTDDVAGNREAARLVASAYGAEKKRQQLSKAELRALGAAAAASGVPVQQCPPQTTLPADLRIEPKRPKLR